MTTERVSKVDAAALEAAIRDEGRPVVVVFFAPWCGVCTRVLPLIEELAEEVGDAIRFLKLNVDEMGDMATRLEVSSIPTFVRFESAREVERVMGAMPVTILRELLASRMD